MVNEKVHLLLPLELVLLNTESHLQQILLLRLVHVFQTSGDRGTGVATRIHDVFSVMVLSLVEKRLDTGLDKTPSTSVEGLFLCPHNGLGVRVHVEVFLELLPWEGVELLDACEGDVVNLVVGAVLVQGGPDLASAENDAVNLLGGLDGAGLVLGVGDDPLEAGIRASEVFNVRAGKGMTQQGLGEEDDES